MPVFFCGGGRVFRGWTNKTLAAERGRESADDDGVRRLVGDRALSLSRLCLSLFFLLCFLLPPLSLVLQNLERPGTFFVVFFCGSLFCRPLLFLVSLLFAVVVVVVDVVDVVVEGRTGAAPRAVRRDFIFYFSINN